MNKPSCQYESKNTKWLKTISYMNEHKMFYNNGVSSFPLTLYDESLQGVDPFDEDLSNEIKEAIIKECMKNPVYFARECVKNKNGEYLRLNMAVIAALRCIVNHSNIYLNIPYYDQYDFLVQTILIIITGLMTSSNGISIYNFNWDDDLVVLPDYFDTFFHYDVSKFDGKTEKNDKAVYFLNEFDYESSEYKFVDQIIAKQAAYADMSIFPSIVLTSFQEHYIPMVGCSDYYNIYSATTMGSDFLMRMPDSHIIVRIQYDVIELEINIRDSFKIIEERITKESKFKLDILERIKLFAKYVLIKDYDQHDVLEKLYINRIYADLSNGV